MVRNPAYWIGIVALVGGIIGYACDRRTGWFDSGLGTAIGILIGVFIYANFKDNQRNR